MKNLGICVELRALDELDAMLAKYSRLGYRWVEIPSDKMPLILNGKLCLPWVEKLHAVMAKYDLNYSVHIGRGCDFRDMRNLELMKHVHYATVDLAEKLGATRLVLHFEEEKQNREQEQYIRFALRELAAYAADKKVLLCIENIETELTYKVVDFVREINHPNLRMTLDTGHAYLSANYFGTDLLEDVRYASDVVSHIHINDNFGLFDESRITNRVKYDSQPMPYRYAFAKGDIHLPIGFGDLPFSAIFEQFNSLENVVLINEYSEEDFRLFADEIYQLTTALLNKYI